MSERTDLPPSPDPLPHPVVDNHCHLDLARRGVGPRAVTPDDGCGDEEPRVTESRVTEAIERGTAVGVPRIVQIGCDLPGARWAVAAAERHEALVAGVALHPNEAPDLASEGRLEEALAEIERLAGASARVRAVGETGLDYYRTGEEGRAAQQESFRRHVALAHRLDRTLVVHDRDAHDDVVTVLDECGWPERTVLHCFSGDAGYARVCLDRGAWLSFAGTVTFKNAEPLREALRMAPVDRVLVETDAPYLTPVPFRGRTNGSHLVPLTVRAMAQVRDADVADLCVALEQNTFAAYGGSW